jgi:hypothetical protein
MIPICGALTLSPVRARKNDFVGGAIVSPFPSAAASWAKLVTALHKQSSAANVAVRKITIKTTRPPSYINTRNDTSFAVFRGSVGAERDRARLSPEKPSSLRLAPVP